jgi:hypothetical protein
MYGSLLSFGPILTLRRRRLRSKSLIADGLSVVALRRSIGIGNLSWQIVVAGHKAPGVTAAHLGLSISGRLTLGGGMGVSDLALFAAGSSFGDGSSLGTAGRLYSFSSCRAGCIFGLTEILPHGRIGFGPGQLARCIGGLAGGGLGDLRCCLSFSLGKESLLPYLLSGSMAQLGAILPA